MHRSTIAGGLAALGLAVPLSLAAPPPVQAYGQPPLAVCTPGIHVVGAAGFGQAKLTAHPCGAGREFQVRFDGVLGPPRFDLPGRESDVFLPGHPCTAVGWLGWRTGDPARKTYHAGRCG
jgi:hypothetical protein